MRGGDDIGGMLPLGWKCAKDGEGVFMLGSQVSVEESEDVA